jgi:hypothetical protein
MRREPPVNLPRFAANIALDATLLRWFAYNGRRDEVMAAIEIELTRAKDTAGLSGTPLRPAKAET